MSIRYHYQGKILEAEQWEHAGHAIKIQDPEHPGRFHYIWPEQVIKNGVPAQDPYGMHQKGPTLHPERFITERRAKAVVPSESPARVTATGGGISLGDLCKELSVEPSLARRILRKGMEKPGGSWTFSPADAERARELIRKGL